MIDRRMLVLGSVFATAGCATRTPDQCDPNNGDMFDYFSCQQQYRDRYGESIHRLNAARARNNAAVQTNRELQSQVAALQAQLDQTNGNVRQLSAEQYDLERRIADLRDDNASVQDAVYRVIDYLKRLDAANVALINFQFPPLPPGAQNLVDRKRQLDQKAAEAHKTIWEKIEEIGKIAVWTVAKIGAGKVVEKVLERALRDTAAEAISPLLSFGLLIHDAIDVYDAIQEGRRTWSES